MDSNILIPQFTIKDVVYEASIAKSQKWLDCPDCLGAKEWTTTSPAGQEYTFPCPRCAQRNTDGNERLDYHVWESQEPRRLTIGSVRIDTAEKEDRRVQYMCEETGVGSGSVYSQVNLYWTADDAFEAGKIRAQTLNDNCPQIKDNFIKRVDLASYLFKIKE